MRTAAILAVSILSSLCACARDDVPADDRGSEDQTGDAEETSETGEDCPPGTLACSCDIGSTCDGDLSCVAGTCQSDSCGDGIVDAGEECDDGNQSNTDMCLADCTQASCGDGFVGPGEGCDDGNDINDDGCTNVCTLETCGDGVVQPGEACDDGDDDNTDDCLDTCVSASCGDGVVQGEFEECDDGNLIDSDSCVSCTIAFCGDGHLWADNEQCDDGNRIDNDGCDLSCSVSTGVKRVAVGGTHTCALTWAGQVKCWGTNTVGELGHGNTDLFDGDETPASLGWIDIGGPAIDIAAGGNHNCALFEDHSVVCWGYNLHGQLGYGHTNNIGDDELPSSAGVIELDGDAVELGLGGSHSCALMVGGGIRCWGQGSSGQLGYGDQEKIGDDDIAGAGGDVDLGGPAVQISVANAHTCALTEAGEVYCWGYNFYGNLGYGHTDNIGDDETPASVGPVDLGPKTVVEVQSGTYHNCARFDDGTVKCWGHNAFGQLGYGHTNNIGDDETPAAVGFVNIGGPVLRVDAIGEFSCTLHDGGSVKCWGHNSSGQLGYGHPNNIGDNELPSSVGFAEVGVPVVALGEGAGVVHVCAVTASGSVRCWGSNGGRRLGYPNVFAIGDDELPSSAGDVELE